MRTDERFAADWAVNRPHVPMPIIDASVSSVSFQQLIQESLWSVKPGDDLYEDTSRLCAGFVVPPFQRPLVWDQARERRFVESAWLGFHLGIIVWNDAGDAVGADGRFHRTDRWLVDGQQRLTALTRYAADSFPIFVGTEHEHRYSDLNQSEVRKFNSFQIGYARISTTDEAKLRHLYNVMAFDGGIAHTEDQRA